ncbi:MAG: hypothetical protein AMK75_03980 [Planctomycetes bacterium SM23_65]|nr:MAG: hypothetical protein AMK75_03980 [Planctomycetes bacterium SM23_65]
MRRKKRRFIVSWTTRDLEQFRRFAGLAARLVPLGEVLADVSTLADKAFHIIPPGGSSWHEYSANWPTLHRVFPHPKLAPHLPADWVRVNRELLLAKAAVLRGMGLGASFYGNDPHFWPESFWQEHPHLRGPRIDHPRRSRKEEFSVCTDLDESREMLAWEMCELKRNVPELEVFIFNTNDAGSGLCWAVSQYAGPNGPRHCRHITAGERVRRFLETLHAGARKGGGDVAIHIGNRAFWRNEIDDVVARLPENSHVTWKDPTSTTVPVTWHGQVPVRGLVNPLSIIRATERLSAPEVKTVFLHFSPPTHRGDMTLDAISKALDVLIDCIEQPVKGIHAQFEELHALCVRWAGKKQAEPVFEAFYRMDEALRTKAAVAPRFRPIQAAVSMRHLTRPLVVKPELLAPEEEAYFLPYIFNIRESEARTDYIDVHGGRLSGPADWQTESALDRALDELRDAAALLEDAKDAPESKWLLSVATSMRIYAALVRSIRNFYFGQKIRDRHAGELSREVPAVPEKVASWEGEGAILEWNERMRDELDNANELLALLEERGTGQIFHAEGDRHQSCFLLGPDLVGDLKKKVKIMREHWLDVERYLAPPHK